jgi:hypothetical protein
MLAASATQIATIPQGKPPCVAAGAADRQCHEDDKKATNTGDRAMGARQLPFMRINRNKKKPGLGGRAVARSLRGATAFAA